MAAGLVGILSMMTCNAPDKRHIEWRTEQTPDIRQNARDFRDEFYKIGLESTIDNIERGGVGVISEDGIVIYEIENDIRADEERFARYKDGDNTLYGILSSNISIAATTSSGCMPEFAISYHVTAITLQGKLCAMMSLKGEPREKVAEDLWPVYDQFVRHCMYVKDESQYENIKQKHQIIFHFHTHPNGSSGSLVDKRLSHERIEIVVSIAGNKYQLFYLKDGKEELIDSYDPSLASKD